MRAELRSKRDMPNWRQFDVIYLDMTMTYARQQQQPLLQSSQAAGHGVKSHIIGCSAAARSREELDIARPTLAIRATIWSDPETSVNSPGGT